MSNLLKNILSQLALGAVEDINFTAFETLLGLPPGTSKLLSAAKPLFKGAAQTAVLKMYDDICDRQISTIEIAKVEYTFQKAEQVFWDFVDKEGVDNAGYSFDADSPDFEGARQYAEGALMSSMGEFERKKLDVIGSFFGRNLYYGNNQWESIYQKQKMIERLTYRQIILIRLISEQFPGQDQKHSITAPDACVEVMDLLNYGIWKAPGAFLSQDNSQPIKLKSLDPTPYAKQLSMEFMLDDIAEDEVRHILDTLKIGPSDSEAQTLSVKEVGEFKESKEWHDLDGDVLDKITAQDSDIDEIYDRVDNLEENQLSLDYDEKNEGLSVKVGKQQ